MGSVNSATLKDKKKEGKQNAMAKQFGSLGKSMGKKLKHLSNNLAPSKGGKAGVDGDKGQSVSVGGSLTQSTKVITALATTGGAESEDSVHCAKLTCQFEDTREVFVNNYLKDAERRFLQEQDLKRQKAEEQRTRPPARPTLISMSQGRMCRTPHCKNRALPDVSLCDTCASDMQWQQGGTLDRSSNRGQGQPLGYNTFPGRHKAPTGLPHSAVTSDEIYKYGKSKFYTPHPDPPPAPNRLQVLGFSDRQQSMSTGNVARPLPGPRPRSPSPDYERGSYGKENNPHCATAGCDFYGSKETGNLCSSCYKKQAHLAKPEKTTRL